MIRKIPEDFSSTNYSSQSDDLSSTPKASIPRSSSGRLRTFVDRVHNVAKTHQQRLISNLPSSPGSTEFPDRSDPSSPVSTSMPPQVEVPKVLIFTLNDGHAPLGLEAEEKIMNAVQPISQRKHTTSNSLSEKKTRFKATESIVSDHTATDADPSSDVDDEEEGIFNPGLKFYINKQWVLYES